MASDNPQKRALVNRAVLILNARTSAAKVFFDEITDDEFSAPFDNITSQHDKLAACVAYENVLLMVLSDLKPDFAKKYADLGAPVLVDKESAEWEYLFEFPSDYNSELKDAVRQISQDNHKKTFGCEVLHFESYSHIVNGDDGQTYKCATTHTSADDSSDGEPSANDGSSNWTLYDTNAIGVAHSVYSYSYKNEATGDLLATNNISNNPSATVDSDIDSAFIEYIPYTQAGINDKPEYYNEHFKNAFCTRLAAEIARISKDYATRVNLLQEYDLIAKPDFRRTQQSRVHIKKRTTIFEARTQL